MQRETAIGLTILLLLALVVGIAAPALAETFLAVHEAAASK